MLSLSEQLRTGGEAIPGLFHLSHGVLDPTTLILTTSRNAQEIERNLDVGALAEHSGSLLHERLHWLQLVGTASGMFQSLLLDAQVQVFADDGFLDSIRSSQLPLIDTVPQTYPERTRHNLIPSGSETNCWASLEVNRLIYSGTRFGNLINFRERNIHAHYEWASDLLGVIASNILTGPARQEQKRRWSLRDPRPVDHINAPILDRDGWAMGAKHLMECGAQINGSFEYMDLLARTQGITAVEVDSRFTGVYGVARNEYYKLVGWPTYNHEHHCKEVGLAYLCDQALNTPVPPVLPLWSSLVYSGQVFPGVQFVRMAEELKNFNFNREIDIYDPESIDDFCRSLNSHLLNSEYGPAIAFSDTLRSDLLEMIDPQVTIDEIYKVESNQVLPPRPEGGSVLTYLRSCWAHAHQVRQGHPGFFAFPFPWYSDYGKFVELFKSMEPPLVSHGAQGIIPGRFETGWLEYFLIAAIQRSALRGMMLYDLPMLGKLLNPMIRCFPDSSYGMLIARKAIYSLFGESQFSSELYGELSV